MDPIQPNPQIDLAPNTCYDFYFEVELNPIAASFDQTRRYRIDVTYDDPDSGFRETITSPTPREIYVERLISQNRNSVIDVELDSVSVPVGGAMDLMVGETYIISLDASTATQGYEQIESFIHFPNTIFQVLSVNTDYSADSSAHVDNPNNKLYADSCLWENDPDNPNYRSCLDVGKNGGTVRVDYEVKIIGGAGTSDTLNSLIYDFSGSSFHYNADYSVSYRVFNIIGPSSITISKRFIPDSITAGSSSTLSFTIPNPTSTIVEGVNFTDLLPVGVVVSNPANVSTIGCGSPTFTPLAGNSNLNFSGGKIAPNSSCQIKVDVTAASDGTYVNTTDHLFINTSVDTGNTATDTLTVGSVTSCTPGQEVARWVMDPSQGVGVPPTFWTKAGNVSAAIASSGGGATTFIDVGVGNPINSWGAKGFEKTGSIDPDASPYFQFQIESSSYSDLDITFDFVRETGWVASPDSNLYVYSSPTGAVGSFTFIGSSEITAVFQTINLDADITGSSDTYFRIFAIGANNKNSSYLYIDNIIFTGCLETDPPPTITKSFASDPITVGGTSTLTFTLSNLDAAAVALTGVQFSDLLPTGLVVADPPNASTTCAGTPTWAPLAGSTNLVFGTPAGATMAAGSSCTLSVDITATAAGFFENISDYISSDQSGENKTSSGYATDTLTVVAPPSISKDFNPTTILRDADTTLSFRITNPNQSQALTGIAFSDTLPVGLELDASTPPISACGGTLTLTDNAVSADTVVLTGGVLAADSSCTFNVTATGLTTGAKDNLTSAVTSTEGGDGNTASASVFVKEPAPKINLLKRVGSTASGPWISFLRIGTSSNIYYKFVVENIGDTTLSSVDVTDPASYS